MSAISLCDFVHSNDASDRAAVIQTLERFGAAALAFARTGGVRVVLLQADERYDAASPALLRLGAAVDRWPSPPAGLFVVEERTVYLRSRSPMTVAHEFGHALDCALGMGAYHSSTNAALRALFFNAHQFVTPYAATAPDEYFAEAMRAYVECNDAASLWPRATRERLRTVDPSLFHYVEQLFAVGFASAA
ncbi:MAG: hypothetical protein NVS1B14_03630 [Vulcanimicrobiaceae bacterium]